MALNDSNNLSGNVGGVNKYVDTAYDNIKKVADNLEALLALEQSFSSLNGISLGAFAVEPTERPDTFALQDGDHYLNTTNNLFYVYFEGAWIFHSIFYTQTGLDDAVGKGPFNIWIAYADDGIGSNISLNPTDRKFIGMLNGQSTATVSLLDPGAFTWTELTGNSSYLHIAYADSADGSVNFNTSSGAWLGQLVNFNVTASSNFVDYNWVRILGDSVLGADGADGNQGAPGIQGDPGIDATITVEAPTIVSGLTFDTNDFSTKIGWDIPNYSGHDYVKIYRTTWDGLTLVPFSELFEVKQARGTEFLDYGLLSQQNYLYWFRNVNIDGTESALASGGVGFQVLTLIGLKDTTAWIIALNLGTLLGDRINLIDTTLVDGQAGIFGAYNALNLNHTALSNAHDVLDNAVGDAGSGLTQAHNLLRADYDLTAVQVGDLNSGLIQDLNLAEADITAQGISIGANSSSIITLTGVSDANALSITSLQSQVNSSNINLMPNYNFEGIFVDHLIGGSITASDQYAGANSLQINSGAQFVHLWEQHLDDGFPAYEESQAYTIGFWAKNTDGVAREFAYADSGSGYGNITVPVSAIWTWFTTSFTVPAGFTTDNDIDGDFWAYEMRTITGWTGSVFIDNVVLLRGTHTLDGSETFTTNEAAFASASAIDLLQTSVTNLNGVTSAQAIQITALEVITGNHTSSITTLNSVTSTNATNITTVQTDLNLVEIQAQTSEDNAAFTIKVEANGNVAGIGLIATDTSTAIVFQADLVAISNGIGGSVLPFVVSNNIVYMENARIKLLEAATISNVGFVPGEAAVATLGNVSVAGTFNLTEPGQIKWKDLDSSFSNLLVTRTGVSSGGNRTASVTTFNNPSNIYAAQSLVASPNDPLTSSGKLLTIDVFFSGGVSQAEAYNGVLTAPSVSYTLKRKNLTTTITDTLDTAVVTGVVDTIQGFDVTKIDYSKTVTPTVGTEDDNYEYWVEITAKGGDWGQTVADGSTKGFMTLAVNEAVSNLEDITALSLTLQDTNPTMSIVDTDSTGASLTAEIAFRDSTLSSKATVGWETPGNTNFNVRNSLGTLQLLANDITDTGIVINSTLSYFPAGGAVLPIHHGHNFATNNVLGNDVITDGFVLTWNDTLNYWEPLAAAGGGGGGLSASVNETITGSWDFTATTTMEQVVQSGVAGFLKVKNSGTAITAHSALIGASTTANEYLFGGHATLDNTMTDYIRIGVDKLEFNSTSYTNANILHAGNFVAGIDYVSISGAETITGVKTFNQEIRVQGGIDTNSGQNVVIRRAGVLGLTVHSNGTSIPSGLPFYLDGGVDTYIQEDAANNLRIVTGGIERLNVNSSGIQLPGDIILTGADSSISINGSSVTNGRVISPGGAFFTREDGTTPEAIAIKLPTAIFGDRDMVSFWVDVMAYGVGLAYSIFVSAYVYQGAGLNTWHNVTIVVEGDRAFPHTIRLADDGTRPIMYIGELNTVHPYPKVQVRDLQIGFAAAANISEWANGWSITGESVSFNTVDSTYAAGTFQGHSTTTRQLATARTIAGVNFDGTANISLNNNAITNGAGYVTSSGNTIIGTDTNYSSSSASVLSSLTLTDGVITAHANRTLTPANIGAATAAHTHTFQSLTSTESASLNYYTTGRMQAKAGFIGTYDDAASGSWCGPIWGMDDGFTGVTGGLNALPTSCYGLRWNRFSSTNARAAVGEGVYVYQNGVFQAGMGTSGIETDGAIVAVGSVTALSLTVTNGIVMDQLLYLDGGLNTYITENTADRTQFVQGGNERFFIDTGGAGVTAGDFHIDYTRKLTLDADENSYIVSDVIDNIRVFTGGVARTTINSSALTQSGKINASGDITSTGGDIILPSLKKVRFEGAASDTYLEANTANNLRVVAGGTERLNVNSSGAQVVGALTATTTLTLQGAGGGEPRGKKTYTTTIGAPTGGGDGDIVYVY